jgi:hypothetical protein
MQGVPDEVAGEGETFEEAAQDAVRRRHQILGDAGFERGKPDWVKVIRLEVLAHTTTSGRRHTRLSSRQVSSSTLGNRVTDRSCGRILDGTVS